MRINKNSLQNVDLANLSINMSGLSSFGLDKVLLTDNYYINAVQKEIEYLLSFDAEKLLAGFYETAGIMKEGLTRYEGWESLLIGGHTIGHYLTACVNAHRSTNTSKSQKKQLLTMVATIIRGLKECQDVIGTGFIFGSIILDRENIEVQFDHVEHNRTNIFTQAWVPWYTMHKIFEGLISVAQMEGPEGKQIAKDALEVACRLGDWTFQRVSRWTPETRKTVIGIEYGGMNDCLYDLYQLTKDVKYAQAAHAFDQTELFEKVLHGKQGDNVLNNYHANTTIPKFNGALNRYISYMEDTNEDAEIYLDYAKAFWEMVVKDHTYITGGNSEWEHFGLDDVLDAERTNCNNETCNAYNMLKLTKKLFMLTGEVKYADYYENTFLNSIMSSQNPETGMTTYFQPMATGFFKVYGERFNKFWCCTGSGMENFTKLGESFYYHKEKLLVVNQYISSELYWTEKKVTIFQDTKILSQNFSEFTVKITEGTHADIDIAFRLPDWLAAEAVLRVNGIETPYLKAGGYAILEGPFEDETRISVLLPMMVNTFRLPDNKDVYGFKYGPVVLSALLGSKDMEESTTGVNVTIPLVKLIEKCYTKAGDDTITVMTDTVEEFIGNIEHYLVKDTSTEDLAFKLQNTDANLAFVPHYSQHKERYGIYWYFISHAKKQSIEVKTDKAKPETLRLDTIQPGYGQYENDELHNLQEYGTGSTGDTSVGTSRYANEKGSFSYRMLVDIVNGTNLLATFKTSDNGKTLKIKVGETVVFEQILQSDMVAEEYDVLIPLSTEVLSSNSEIVTVNGPEMHAVTFIFEGSEGKVSARLCNFLYSFRA